MNHEPQRFGAVVAAAGVSARMGRDKLTLPIGGTTIIRSGVETLLAAGASPVAVVVGHRANALARHLNDLPVTCVYNPDYARRDMFASVRLGLRALAGLELAGVFFLPGDVPLFRAENLVAMQRLMAKTGCSVVVPRHEGKHGHPILLAGGILPDVIAYDGDGGLKRALERLGVERTVYQVEDVGMLLDADVPADYARLLAHGPEYGKR